MREYMDYYFKTNPRCKTFPFAKRKSEKKFKSDGTPDLTDGGNQRTKKRSLSKSEITDDDLVYSVLSLNEILIIPDRIQMNSVKEKWGEFGEWIATKHELNNKLCTNSVFELRVFSKTHANKDLDNLGGGIKFLNDSLIVKSGFMKDDNFNHICPLLISAEVDKNNPRTEIRITLIDEDIKDIYEKTQIHINNWK
jgi:hypothetical protein